MSPRRKIFTFAIDEDISSAMKKVKQAMGLPESEQARQALRFWLGIGGEYTPNMMLRIKHEELKKLRETNAPSTRKKAGKK